MVFPQVLWVSLAVLVASVSETCAVIVAASCGTAAPLGGAFCAATAGGAGAAAAAGTTAAGIAAAGTSAAGTAAAGTAAAAGTTAASGAALNAAAAGGVATYGAAAAWALAQPAFAAVGELIPVLAAGTGIGLLTVGADVDGASVTWDCWKPILHESSTAPSRGRLLLDILNDPVIQDYRIEHNTVFLQNRWNESWRIDPLILPWGQVAAHASRTGSMNSTA